MGTFCGPFVLFEFLLPHSVSVVAPYFCLHSGACDLVLPCTYNNNVEFPNTAPQFHF